MLTRKQRVAIAADAESSLSQSLLAKLIGVSARRLRQLDEEGSGPPRNSEGRYPIETLGPWLRERFRADSGSGPDAISYSLEAERARLAKWQADKTEQEVELRAGRMLDRDAVLGWISDDYSTVKARLTQIPDAVAAALPADVAQRVAADVRTLVYEALAELSAEARLSREREEDAGAAAGADGEPMGGQVPAPIERGLRAAGKVGNE